MPRSISEPKKGGTSAVVWQRTRLVSVLCHQKIKKDTCCAIKANPIPHHTSLPFVFALLLAHNEYNKNNIRPTCSFPPTYATHPKPWRLLLLLLLRTWILLLARSRPRRIAQPARLGRIPSSKSKGSGKANLLPRVDCTEHIIYHTKYLEVYITLITWAEIMRCLCCFG